MCALNTLLDKQSRVSAKSTPDSLAVCITTQGKTSSFLLSEGESLLIGSGPQCRLRIVGENVSPMHCILRYQGGEIALQDWCSTHGTRVNGTNFDSGLVTFADKIEIGPYVLTFLIPDDQLDRQSTHDEITPTSPEESNHAPTSAEAVGVSSANSNAGNSVPQSQRSAKVTREPAVSVEQGTLELLKSEIEDLQQQLELRDQRIAELKRHTSRTLESESVESPLAGITESRVRRLLSDLDQSEQRVAVLEEFVHMSEEQHRADAEEKRQLDDWVRSIEQRMCHREAEVKAECDVLRNRLNHATEQGNQLQTRIAALLEGKGGDPSQIVHVLQQENSHLREKLLKQGEALSAAQKRSESLELQNSEASIAERVNEAVRLERLQLAQERAAFSRLQLELTKKVQELKYEMERQNRTNPADEKFQAFRERLKELHEEEKQEYRPPSITQRLAQLWQRLDGPTDRD